MSAFVVSNISPSLKIDNDQRFIFGLAGSPEPLGSFKLDNIYTPILGSPSFTNFEIRNQALSGYRWIHETQQGETYGSFKLQRFLNASPTGIDIMSFNDDGTFNIPGTGTVTNVSGTSGQIDVLNGTSTPVVSISPTYAGQNSITTLGTITSGTWNGSILSPTFGGTGINNGSNTITTAGNLNFAGAFSTIGSFPTAFTMTGNTNVTFPTSGTLATLSNTLNQFASPTTSLSMNSQRITSVSDPLNAQDAATKSWVTSQITGNLNLPRLGIGFNPTVDGRIQFANTEMVNKISLFNTSGNDYNQNGFGYSGLGTLYHAQLGTSHTFYLGNSTTIPLRVNVLGIHIAELRPIDTDYRRIMFYDEGENLHQIYNVGIKTLDGTNHAIHSQVSNFQAAFTWAYGLTAVSSFELMRLNNQALKINNGKLTILESANFTSWDLTPISDGTFSFNKTDIPANKFAFSSNSLSSIFSILNPNSSSTSYFKAGTSTDYVELGYDGSNDYSFLNIQGSSNDRIAFRVNGTGVAALLQSGLFGIGTITPTLAKLEINGGVQNVINQDSCIRVISSLDKTKIELQNTTPSTGNIWTLDSISIGSFGIYNQSLPGYGLIFDSLNNVTFGNRAYFSNFVGIQSPSTTPNAPLQFSNALVNRKIVLFEAANNDHQFTGLGVNTNSFRFQVPSTSNSWTFLAGLSSSSSQQAAQITGTGDIIIPGTYFGRRPTGLIYMQGNVVGVTSVANTWLKVGGTTTAFGFLNSFSQPTNNRLQYTGTNQIIANIDISLTYIYNSSILTRIGFAIYKNGSQVIPSAIYSDNDTTNFDTNIQTGTMVSLTTNDYIEVFFMSPTGGVNLTVTDLIVKITAT